MYVPLCSTLPATNSGNYLLSTHDSEAFSSSLIVAQSASYSQPSPSSPVSWMDEWLTVLVVVGSISGKLHVLHVKCVWTSEKLLKLFNYMLTRNHTFVHSPHSPAPQPQPVEHQSIHPPPNTSGVGRMRIMLLALRTLVLSLLFCLININISNTQQGDLRQINN